MNTIKEFILKTWVGMSPSAKIGIISFASGYLTAWIVRLL